MPAFSSVMVQHLVTSSVIMVEDLVGEWHNTNSISRCANPLTCRHACKPLMIFSYGKGVCMITHTFLHADGCLAHVRQFFFVQLHCTRCTHRKSNLRTNTDQLLLLEGVVVKVKKLLQQSCQPSSRHFKVCIGECK